MLFRIAAVLITVLLSGCAREEADEIKIGVITPRTGAVSSYGASVRNGLELALNEINSNGGVLGKRVQLVQKDDKGNPTEGVNAINSLISQDVKIIIGAVTSNVTAAIAPIAESEGVLLLTPTATSDLISDSDTYVYRCCYKDSYQGEMAARYADWISAKEIGVLYASGDAYSRGLAEGFIAACEESGLNITAVEISSGGVETDFYTQLSKIINAGCDFLFAPYYYDVAAPFIIPQARKLGYYGIIMGGDGYDGMTEYVTDNPGTYNNVRYTNHYSPDDEEPLVKGFVTDYTAAYPIKTLTAHSALSYDSLHLICQAIENAKSDTPEAVINALNELVFEGITGEFSVTNNAAPEKQVSVIGLFNNGDKVESRFLEKLTY